MKHYLWDMRPYFRQVAGELVLGSIAGIVMNIAVVLPAILLGRAIDTALALERGEATASAVAWAGLAFVGGTVKQSEDFLQAEIDRWGRIIKAANIKAE